ncbi:MAG: GNAT family N-acetyltransferase [Nitratireductor sp.]|nr:GNAT family N-acetyltransferase [Nitratireductor sp.]
MARQEQENNKRKSRLARGNGLFPFAEPDPLAPDTTVLSETAGIDGSHWQLCLHPFSYRRSDNPDLVSLTGVEGRTPGREHLENIFFNPAFLAASRGRMERRTIFQLVLWEVNGAERRAHFAVPLARGSGFRQREHYRALVHPFAPLGSPLFDPDAGASAIARLADLLIKGFENGLPPLLIPLVAEGSCLEALAVELENRKGCAIRSREEGHRAAIARRMEPGAVPGRKHRRELRRLGNRLAELGEVRYEVAETPFDVLLRFEEYLLMETRTWKGRRGTSIHAMKRHAAFARQTVSDLAAEGRCRIYSMRLDGNPLAAIILFTMNGTYMPWKITFDEHYARFSPGTQLMVRMTDALLAEPGFRMADSLAHTGRSWMSLLWPDEIALRTHAIAATAEEARQLVQIGQLRDRLRAIARKWLRR